MRRCFAQKLGRRAIYERRGIVEWKTTEAAWAMRQAAGAMRTLFRLHALAALLAIAGFIGCC